MSTTTRKVANTALKVVTTPARRSGRLPSPAEEQAQINLALVAGSWASMDLESQQTFNFLGQTWSPNPKKATASGFSVYKSLNLARLALEDDLLTTCPQFPEVVPKLGPIEVTATLNDTGEFTLTVITDPFEACVLVSASRPKSPGTTKFRADQGRILTYLPGLSAGPTVISGQYLSVFPRPQAGTRLCVFLTPVSSSGFRGVTRWRSVIVTRLVSPEFSVTEG